MPRKSVEKPRIRIIPLGGVNEFGKNITLVEYQDDIVVVDCGSVFPQDEMLGVDLVIPDVTYLIKNREKVRGMLLTHGHEDHIGATPYVLRQVPMPIFGTKLTLALVDLKLKEHRIAGIPLNVIRPGDEIHLGCFTCHFIHVNHSIPGAVAIAITCPAGTVVFSGDFKVDYTPPSDEVTDLASLAEYGSKGVLAFLCESTNIGRKGYTMSERGVGETFDNMFQQAQGRVIVAMFASNVHRLQMLVDTGMQYGRRVCFVGRSMVNVSRVARSIGELNIPDEAIIDVDDVDNYHDDEILIVTTGSQGETMAGLTRMARGEHRRLQIRPTDTVIMSAHPIPGNEKPVAKVLNELYRCGAQVIYGQLGEIHVSGHACQEEIKLFHALLKPKYFIPIHGDYSNLWQHAELAESMGTPSENIVLPELGQVIEMNDSVLALGEQVPTGDVLVDGLCIGDVGNTVLKDRKHLSEDGVIVVTLAIDKDSGKILSGPELTSRGFVYVQDEDIMVSSTVLARQIAGSYNGIKGLDVMELKNRLKDELRRFINDKMKRNPMILPVVIEV